MNALSFPKRRSEGASELHPWAAKAALMAMGAVLLLLLIFAWLYWSNWSRYDSALNQVESRVARVDGLLASSAEVDSRLAQARQSVNPWLFKGGSEGQNAVLQRLRDLVVTSGATLISSQIAVVPAENEQKLPKARVSATISGEWAHLVQLGVAIERQRPPFLVHALNIQREGQANSKTAQKARMTLQIDAPMAELEAKK